jgi:hypothetical protein
MYKHCEHNSNEYLKICKIQFIFLKCNCRCMCTLLFLALMILEEVIKHDIQWKFYLKQCFKIILLILAKVNKYHHWKIYVTYHFKKKSIWDLVLVARARIILFSFIIWQIINSTCILVQIHDRGTKVSLHVGSIIDVKLA